ncbi:MAG: 2'-5' RNA ligase family protein [Nanoarchaeota archaeon]|nr:2'-5' RNA ligase family protein [Nanoarchaeota archaeon]
MAEKLYVAHLGRGIIAEYYKDLISDLCSEFSLPGLNKRQRLPHITFKSPFSQRDPKEVQRVMRDLAKSTRPFPILIDGFDFFKRNNLLYIAADTTTRGRDKIERIMATCQRELGAKKKGYDQRDRILHLTVVKRKEVGSAFPHICEYVEKIAPPKFRIMCDNIALLGRGRGLSGIREAYELG